MSIPEVHEYSSNFYWKEIFPKSYTHRNIVKLGNTGLIADGDISNNRHCIYCDNNTYKPKLFGTFDVGHELVYECTKCGKSKVRIYTSIA